MQGWITLGGYVDWYYQKIAAEDDVRKLSGVCGLTNKIAIKSSVSRANVKSKIESALKRHTELEAKAIQVTVQNGNMVILEGKVDNWDERRAVENAACSAAGVASVEDRLTIEGSLACSAVLLSPLRSIRSLLGWRGRGYFFRSRFCAAPFSCCLQASMRKARVQAAFFASVEVGHPFFPHRRLVRLTPRFSGTSSSRSDLRLVNRGSFRRKSIH